MIEDPTPVDEHPIYPDHNTIQEQTEISPSEFAITIIDFYEITRFNKTCKRSTTLLVQATCMFFTETKNGIEVSNANVGCD